MAFFFKDLGGPPQLFEPVAGGKNWGIVLGWKSKKVEKIVIKKRLNYAVKISDAPPLSTNVLVPLPQSPPKKGALLKNNPLSPLMVSDFWT
jgi:hypothetical protein